MCALLDGKGREIEILHRKLRVICVRGWISNRLKVECVRGKRRGRERDK